MSDDWHDSEFADDDDGADVGNSVASSADATSGEGLPGVPVESYSGLRAGAFSSGQGALGLLRVGDDAPDANVYPAAANVGRVPAAAAAQAGNPADPPWTRSPLTFYPVPGHTQVLPANPVTEQGDGHFGYDRNGGTKEHTGVDYDAPVGTPVVAPADGMVIDVKPNPSPTYGNQVVIDHGGGVNTQSAHLSRVDVKPGQRVYAGFPIGLSGKSGNAGKTPQVHFEVRQGSPAPRLAGGNPVDPANYLPPWCFQ